MKIKKNSFNVKSLILGIFIGLFFAGTFTFATALWHGTDWIEDGEVISAEMMKDNFDYLLSLFGDSCTENNLGQVRVESGSLVTCNGEEWDSVSTAVLCGNGDSALYEGNHTESECLDAGGQVSVIGSDATCDFSASSCPSGWSSYNGLQKTSSNTCSFTSRCGSCTTSSRTTWGTGVATCTYKANTGGTRGCWDTKTCRGNISNVACY